MSTDGIVVPEKRSEVNSRVLSKKECKSFEYSKEWMNMPDTMMCTKMPMPEDKDFPYYSSYDCPVRHFKKFSSRAFVFQILTHIRIKFTMRLN